MRRLLSPLPVIALAVALPACGNDKTDVPETGTIPAPKGFRDANYPKDGIFLRVPTNWRVVPGDAPQIVTIAAGDGQIAVWRFPRKEPLPETAPQLGAALAALIQQVRKRDPTFQVRSSRIVRKRQLNAVEIVGVGTNQGKKRSQRSLHAYAHGAEVVVDGFTPVKQFKRVDEQTLARVARSLKVAKPAP